MGNRMAESNKFDDDIGAGIIIKAWLGAIGMFLLIVLISIFIMGF